MSTNKTLAIMALGVFGIATTEFGVIGILPALSQAFQVSIEKAGWLLSAFALVVAISGPFMMILLSAFDRKKLMAVILFVFMASNILSALAGNFYVLLVVRTLPAFLHPVFWSVALTAAAGSVPPHEAPAAASKVFGGFSIASIIGVPLATFAADLISWQAAFYLSAFINLISFLSVLFFLPFLPTIARQSTSPGYAVMKRPALWLGLLLAFLMITAMYSAYSYMADYLQSVSHMSGKTLSMLLVAFGVAGVLGNRLAGKYMGPNGDKTTLFFILALLAVHGLLYVFGSSFGMMILIICLWGLFHTAGYLISNVTVVSSSPDSPEFVNSVFTSCGNFAVTAGAMLGGFWITRFGIHQVVWSSVLLLILALIVLLIKIKRKQGVQL